MVRAIQSSLVSDECSDAHCLHFAFCSRSANGKFAFTDGALSLIGFEGNYWCFLEKVLWQVLDN